MNKKLRSVLIIAGVLVTIWIILNRTRVFSMVKTPTSANEPAIKLGQHFFFSSLPKPERFDFICFTGPSPFDEGRIMMSYRLCGMPGDIVEIRNAQLFINGKLADDSLKVKHQYKVSMADYDRQIHEFAPSATDYFIRSQTTDSIIVELVNKDVADHQLPAVLNFQTQTIHADSLFGTKAVAWTLDNFGPIQVPAGHYFVLGDNRHGAADSRYQGFIASSNVNGVVIWIP